MYVPLGLDNLKEFSSLKYIFKRCKSFWDAKLSRNNFENFFLVDTENFELNFSYPSNVELHPKLYYIDNNEGSKNLIDSIFKTAKGMSTTIQWEKTQGINLKDLIRLEWWSDCLY